MGGLIKHIGMRNVRSGREKGKKNLEFDLKSFFFIKSNCLIIGLIDSKESF